VIVVTDGRAIMDIGAIIGRGDVNIIQPLFSLFVYISRSRVLLDGGGHTSTRLDIDTRENFKTNRLNKSNGEDQRGQSLERQGINSSKLYAGKIERGKYLLKRNGHS
jgi:hypothetical protein